jgi:hypothetical protein
MSTKYYGPSEVEKTEPVLPEGLVRIWLKDEGDEKKSIVISEKMVESVLTDEPTDLTALRDNRIKPVAKAIMQLMLDWNLRVDEIDYLFALVNASFNQNLMAANGMLWGKQADNSIDERTTSDVDQVLKGLKK